MGKRINKIILMGFVGVDLNFRYKACGAAVTQFDLATTEPQDEILTL